MQLAHARALREEFVSPAELTPTYLRKPDAEINWSTREERHLMALRVPQPDELDVTIGPMRRRHLRSVSASSSRSTRAPGRSGCS